MAIKAQGSTTKRLHRRDSSHAKNSSMFGSAKNFLPEAVAHALEEMGHQAEEEIREERNGTVRGDTCERDEADNLMKNKYAVSVYNLSVLEKNVEDYKAEIKRCQRALQRFSKEEKKKQITSELLHYKMELGRAEKEVAQIKKTVDRRARALSSTTKPKADAKTWEAIARYAEQELAHHQEELAAIEAEAAATRKKINSVCAASSGISDELLDDQEEQGCACCNGMESYLSSMRKNWFAMEKAVKKTYGGS